MVTLALAVAAGAIALWQRAAGLQAPDVPPMVVWGGGDIWLPSEGADEFGLDEVGLPACTARLVKPIAGAQRAWNISPNSIHHYVLTGGWCPSGITGKQLGAEVLAESNAAGRASVGKYFSNCLFRMQPLPGRGWKVISWRALGSMSPTVTASSVDNSTAAFLVDDYGSTISIYTYNWKRSELKLISRAPEPINAYKLNATWRIACGNDGSVCYDYCLPDGRTGNAVLVNARGSVTNVGNYFELLSNDNGLFGATIDGLGDVRVHAIAWTRVGPASDFTIPIAFRHGVARVACSDDGAYWAITENTPDRNNDLPTLAQLLDPAWDKSDLDLEIWNDRAQTASRIYNVTDNGVGQFVPCYVALAARRR